MPEYCVIFDLDGVLVDSYHAHFESWRDVAAEEGITITEQEFAASFGRTSREIIRATWQIPSLDEAAIRAIDDRKEEKFRESIRRKFPLMDGAPDLLADLRAGGFRIAVGSSAPPENVELALASLGGAGAFDAVVDGRQVKRGKPDPQVFLLAAERAHAAPRRCVVIEDARPGIEAATRAGMASVALLSTGRNKEDFDGLRPDLVVSSLRHLNAGLLAQVIDAHS